MTLRPLIVLAVFAALSGWVSGQGPTATRTADEELSLLRKNQFLLEQMLDHGLKVSDANTPLDRATECRRAADRLSAELAAAVTAEDADRVAEIGEHLSAVVNEGLVPNLSTATANIRPGSPDYESLQTVHRTAATNLAAAVNGLPTAGKLANSGKVKETAKKLTAAVAAVGTPAE